MSEGLRRYLNTNGFSELVRSVKDPASIDTSKMAITLPVPTEVKALGGRDSRLIEFVITSDRVDREQDVITPDGWTTENFEGNPVVLFAHLSRELPVANAKSLVKAGNKWRSIAEFTPQDLYPFGYMCYRMYAEGFMHACSVGFQPIEYSFAADRKYGINYLKTDLLEYSCVPVPANPDALVIARSKGIDTTPLKVWAEQVLDESRSGLSDDARRRTEILRNAASPSGRALILEIGEMKMTGTEAPATGIKKVERFECKNGHAHTTETEAASCLDFNESVTAFVAQGKRLLGMTKSGSAFDETQRTSVKEMFDSIIPPQPKKEEPIVEEDKGFEIDEAQLTKTITDAVTESVDSALGRVS
jgi:phage head maturation protease